MTEGMEEQLALAVATNWTATGDVRVDSAVDMLSMLREIPVSEHEQVFDDVHRRLQQTLADASGQ